MQTSSLAVRYRPKTLAGLLGQDHIVAQVKGMLREKKAPAAIMLYGPTGLGKTTTARLIVRYLNCSNPDAKTFEPCGECQNCKMKDHPDVTEINAADTRGIDDVRSLIAQARNMPSIGKKRIFIVDEAHQWPTLTQQALLKPLEEPPKDTIWIICTMTPEKMIPAIAKRCMRMAVKPVEPELLVKRLGLIAKKEGVDFKAMEGGDKVLKAIADLANGGVRDAISLLEGVLLATKGNKTIDPKKVLSTFLNSPEAEADQLAVNVLHSILKNNVKGLVASMQLCDNTRGVLNKMRWLVDYLLSNTVGKAKFTPYSGKLFAQKVKEDTVKVSLTELVKVQYLLLEIELRLNTMNVEERVVFVSMVGNYMASK